ncbi:hypothetical protein SARC_01718 [Sphaeroforma arctica JP610]|uniref:Actin maturation protease n=1 Tax=Sphaeroforma arctica JP610 TaxID=667725 RepID=A0A0L0GB76_9EUKA|nr:hypothetical protein SARC_01718 [Sphaeroforma arctica JP610]KNC86149.1 hypothetical protein SARC_01718 [Sphaeroforma arctica JP610]|eukprot:XP_014160051.1 hypothetical protein SARC_01718 [Sphaeroforma arctica JP610]
MCAEGQFTREERCRLQTLLSRAQADYLSCADTLGLPKKNVTWEGIYTPTASLRQEGPMCGISALCMSMHGIQPAVQDVTDTEAFNVLVNSLPSFLIKECDKTEPTPVLNRTTLDTESLKLLVYAITKGITTYGEFFSSTSLADLALRYYNRQVRCVKNWTCSELASQLHSGRLALVPYDADFNHQPCSKKGIKAHWAVLTGMVWISHSDANESANTLQVEACDVCVLENGQTVQDDLRNIRVATIATPIDTESTNAPTEMKTHNTSDITRLETRNAYVLARHGKSSHLALWSLSSLFESNAQLTCMDPTISPAITQRYPPLAEGLCSSIVMLT